MIGPRRAAFVDRIFGAFFWQAAAGASGMAIIYEAHLGNLRNSAIAGASTAATTLMAWIQDYRGHL